MITKGLLKKQMLLMITAIVFIICMFPALHVSAETILETDVEEASDGCTIIGVSGSFNTDAEAALNRINEIRLEACQNGYKDPRDTSKTLSMADYVPIKWSKDLEEIARIRAAESCYTMNHARLNGKSIWFTNSQGIKASGECLAWYSGYGTGTVYGIDLWYSEKMIG